MKFDDLDIKMRVCETGADLCVLLQQNKSRNNAVPEGVIRKLA